MPPLSFSSRANAIAFDVREKGRPMREDTRREKFNEKTMRYAYKFTQTLNMSGNVRISDIRRG